VKRVLMLLTVALLVVALMAATAAPAFAAHSLQNKSGKEPSGVQKKCTKSCKDGPGGFTRVSGPP